MLARWIDVKKWTVWLAVTALAIGGFVLAYRGPGRGIVRGHVGDVAIVMLLYALLAAVAPRMRSRALAILALASAIELGQAVWSATSTLGALTIGDTCDPWDIAAYAIGVGVAVIWERTAVARCAACASPSPS